MAFRSRPPTLFPPEVFLATVEVAGLLKES